jgi:2-desacetyl-2-hydroxyethyl bacteriochlorophyllide A dehydrogenase
VKALVWRDDVALEDVEKPKPGKNDVLIRVGAGSICGSDLTITAGKHPRAKPPLILGHEFMGTVEHIPGNLDVPFNTGDRVVVEPLLSCKKCVPCRADHEHVCQNLKLLGVETDGGFAEFVAAPAEKVYPLPYNISNCEASLIEPASVAVHAVDYAQLKGIEKVAVLGAGPIGLLLAQVVRAAGIEKIWMFDPNGFRADLASSLGFTCFTMQDRDAVEIVLDHTNGEGVDVTFDAAGVPQSAGNIIPMTGIRGRIVMVAIHKKPAEVAFRDLAYREQTIYGVRIYAKGDFQKALELMAGGRIQVEPLITHRYPFDEAVSAFTRAKLGQGTCKIVMEM